MIPIGTRKKCNSCSEVIEWTGQYWRHTESNPRHPAVPETEYMSINATGYTPPILSFNVTGNITFASGIVIHSDGNVTIPEGLSLTAASQEIWNGMKLIPRSTALTPAQRDAIKEELYKHLVGSGADPDDLLELIEKRLGVL